MTAIAKTPSRAVDLDNATSAAAALRTFWRLAEAWKLKPAEQMALLGVGRSALYQWKQGKVGPLDRHVLERLSYLFGIYAALQLLLPQGERADRMGAPAEQRADLRRAVGAAAHARRPSSRPVRRAPVPRCAARRQGVNRRRATPSRFIPPWGGRAAPLRQ